MTLRLLFNLFTKCAKMSSFIHLHKLHLKNGLSLFHMSTCYCDDLRGAMMQSHLLSLLHRVCCLLIIYLWAPIAHTKS